MQASGIALALLLVSCSSGSSGTSPQPAADAGKDASSGAGAVTLSSSCEVPTPCGGSVDGVWTITSGCANVESSCNPSGGNASVSGELEFKLDENSGSPLVIWQDHVEYSACGSQGFSNDDEYGLYQISGTNLVIESSLAGSGTYEVSYCVTGNELWIASPPAWTFPRLAVRHFTRN
jgi:hypothetical protein